MGRFLLLWNLLALGAPQLIDVAKGTRVPGLGGLGNSSTNCQRWATPSCSTLPRQLIGAVDYALEPGGRYIFVATTGLDTIGQCDDPQCKGVAVHDNSHRLLRFDLQRTEAEPVTLSYCGPWKAVEYDAKRKQVIALRHVDLGADVHGTNYAAEVVAFDAGAAAAADTRNATSCSVYPGIDVKQTCACAKGLDPNGLNGRVIGRAGLKKDGILPAATMALLGDSVLVGDQNDFCVRAFPLDGSAGSASEGKPVAGTCGKSCGHQGCGDIGSKPSPAGKLLGDGKLGTVYVMFKTPEGKLLLQDMNTETIDYGSAPKAATQYITAPVDPGASSIYEVPTFDSASGALLVREKFTMNGMLLQPKGNGGYGNAKKVLAPKDLTGTYSEVSAYGPPDVVQVQGVPQQWSFMADGKKLLVLLSYAPTHGGEFLDHAFVEIEVGTKKLLR